MVGHRSKGKPRPNEAIHSYSLVQNKLLTALDAMAPTAPARSRPKITSQSSLYGSEKRTTVWMTTTIWLTSTTK